MDDTVRRSPSPAPTGAARVIEEADAGGVARKAAARIGRALVDAIAARGEASLALSGGNTPRDAYRLLAVGAGVDWSRVRVFWVDERAVPPDHERSNYHAAKTTLLDPARVPADRVHRMPAERPDRAAAAAEYDALIRRHVPARDSGFPTFDAMVLGMGDDGHTASLFPGEPTVSVRDRCVADVPAHAGLEARLTLTAPVIQAAAAVWILVVGPEKRAPLRRAWAQEGDVAETPIRIVRGCAGTATWIVDVAAAGGGRPL